MGRYEVTVSKVVHRTVDEFDTEEKAREFGISCRDSYRTVYQVLGTDRSEYFYDVVEVSNV